MNPLTGMNGYGDELARDEQRAAETARWAPMETPTDWRTLPAGRDLDALVEVRVFGARPEIVAGHIQWEKDVGDDGAGVPAYSRDIDAAWQVVAKLRADGWWFSLTQDNTDIWDAKFWKGEPKGWFPTAEAYGTADTAPLAICRAALAAMEGPTDAR